MIDFNNLPFLSKMILISGFAIGIISFVLVMRYPIMLILMKYNPEYREFIRKTLEKKTRKRKIIFQNE